MHESVMLASSIAQMAIAPNSICADLTYGRGGHSSEIRKQLGEAGRLIVLDQDPQAIAHARATFGEDASVSICSANFRQAGSVIADLGFAGKVNAVLMDIGISSPQVDEAERGFSFMRDGDLDMRMNPDAGISAREWLAKTPELEMARVFRELGDERYPGRIARVICESRRKKPIRRTTELADLIVSAVPGRIGAGKKIHPATRVFQAIRIEVNDELGALSDALASMAQVIVPGGRLVVIAFHSLEDRVVKRFMRDSADFKMLGKYRPDANEVRENPRARSAMLRVAQRQPVESGSAEVERGYR